MTIGTITGTVTTPIILGQGVYGSNLVVSAGAAVEPSFIGATAISGPSDLGSATLTITNDGIVLGANAPHYGTAGAGIVLDEAASVTSSGTITGGSDFDPGNTHQGGAGIVFQARGTLINTGHIVAGYNANAAVVFDAAAHVTNASIIDGHVTAAGLVLQNGGILANTGMIEGGAGTDPRFAIFAGTGLLVNGTARIFNGGDVAGGAGADLASGNAVDVVGGEGGFGLELEGSGSIFDTAGTLTGGVGGDAGFDTAGSGGVGAFVSTGNLLVNSGNIFGGAGGGNGGLLPGTLVAGGTGGTGVIANGEFFNLGVVTGGNGGASNGKSGGAGGTGVMVESGRLVAAAGTISGGAAAAGYAGPSTGLAVAFGNDLPGTLVVDPGAVFIGGVEASTSVSDTLVLGGTASGTLGGFGGIGGMSNFTCISEKAGSHWLLSGGFTSSESLAIGANAFLALDGTVSGSTIGFAQSGGGTLRLDTPATFSGVLSALAAGDAIQLTGLDATSFAYGNDLLALIGSNGETLCALTFVGNYTSSNFHLDSTPGGTQIDFSPPAHG